nr:PREDICTED: semaphorin-3A-like [Paralichthys olivaceus]
MCWPVAAVLLAHLGSTLTEAWRASQPRLQFTHSELIQNGRLLMLPLVAGDLHSLLPDEDGRRLYVAMKDNLLSTSLDDITQNPRKLYWPASPDRVQECLMAGKDPELECANFLRVLQHFNQTHLYICGTGAFNPRCAFVATSVFQRSEHQTLSYSQTECGKGKCPYDPFQKTASAVVDGELYAGITSDFMSRDSAFFRSLGSRHVIRTEQYDSTWLQNAQFVRVAPLSETDNQEDDKVYVFFTERAQEAEGAAGKVLYSRVARVCKDIFILQGKDKKNPLIYGLFTTSSDILNGSAVCVYRMEDIVRAFKGNFLHKEGPQYKWAEFTGKVPYPRPGTCPSSTYGSYSSTREYPDDVIFFSRTHPLLQQWLFVGSREGVSQLALYQCELYGQACAECCLARDPYCTWDGHACSPYMPTVRRRNARHLGEEEDPLTQCVRQGAVLQVEAEQRVMMVAEGNSTYLECLPRSRHAAVTWYKQAGENSPELNQVVTGDQLVVIERGVLIRRAELSHSGVYHCQVEEHGYHWTAVTVRLAVWSASANHLVASWSTSSYQSRGPQPWYEDVMALIHPGNLGQHCRALGYRPPRNHRRHGDMMVEPNKEKGRGDRHKHGGERGGGGRAAGRKSRSKPQQRAPRSA